MRHRLLDPLVDRGPEPLRDHAADDLVDELVADALLDRLKHDRRVAELAAAAGLLLVLPLRARLAADRLQIRDARLVQIDLDAEAPLQPLDGDLDVHLREAGEELLAGLLVAAHDRVGSSSVRRRSAWPSFSSSPLAFGVIAKLITGSG